MNNTFAYIKDIAFLNSKTRTCEELKGYYDAGLFEDPSQWDAFIPDDEIEGLMDTIKARMKYYMSKLALGVYNVMELGPGPHIQPEDEIYLISGFTEIGTVSKIGNKIMEDDYSINPSLFPNSVHHISLCYYTILKKISNYTTAITDGLLTNHSYINFVKNRMQLPGDFIIVSGEENASYFEYEENTKLHITPSFVSYKIEPRTDKGFRYGGILKSLADVKELDLYKKSTMILSDITTYNELKAETDKKLLTEYPLVRDNPCGIAYRLALPFYFDIAGPILVIDKSMDHYHYFEVSM